MTNTDQADALKPSYYIASKTKHATYWRANRSGGDRITATWIDEAGEGESASYTELATRCLADIQRADYLILYCEGREILKGALIEAGMALALGKRVRCVGDCDSISRVFKEHPLWSSHETIIDATSDAWAKRGETTRAPKPEGERLAKIEDALRNWQRTYRETECEYDDCEAAFKQAEEALAAPTAQPEAEPTNTETAREFRETARRISDEMKETKCPECGHFLGSHRSGCSHLHDDDVKYTTPTESQPTAGSSEGEVQFRAFEAAAEIAKEQEKSKKLTSGEGEAEDLGLIRIGRTLWQDARSGRQDLLTKHLCEYITAATSAAERALRRLREDCDIEREEAEKWHRMYERASGSEHATSEKLAAAEQAKAQAEQRAQAAEAVSEARGLLIGRRERRIAWLKKKASQNALSGRIRYDAMKQAEAERDTARAEVEHWHNRAGEIATDHAEQNQRLFETVERMDSLTRELAEARDALRRLSKENQRFQAEKWAAISEEEARPLKEALRAALIPLAVLKMGQQTKPYAEHTATLTAEIASAHDVVYAALLKAQEAKA